VGKKGAKHLPLMKKSKGKKKRLLSRRGSLWEIKLLRIARGNLRLYRPEVSRVYPKRGRGTKTSILTEGTNP